MKHLICLMFTLYYFCYLEAHPRPFGDFLGLKNLTDYSGLISHLLTSPALSGATEVLHGTTNLIKGLKEEIKTQRDKILNLAVQLSESKCTAVRGGVDAIKTVLDVVEEVKTSILRDILL